MRAPRKRHPRKDERRPEEAGTKLEELAATATYIPSPEHKDYLTVAGPGRLRSDASACPRDLKLDQVETWLKQGIRDRHVSAAVEGDYPRYVWVLKDGQAYEARLSNSGLGQYKGYPILSIEAPGWLE